ncbi:hypothetical protein PENTCL1PPCAC_11055, partial [Pristionchus entomophagus]
YEKYNTYDDQTWERMEEEAAKSPDGIFWSGRWCMGKKDEIKEGSIGMKHMQEVMIRDDGKKCHYLQILLLLSMFVNRSLISTSKKISVKFQGTGSLLAPEFNRYIIAEDNYNLNPDGRSLFRALLTMCSDKIARAC